MSKPASQTNKSGQDSPGAGPIPPAHYSEAMWERLLDLGATAEELAPNLPEMTLFEIAAELRKAKTRIDNHKTQRLQLARDYEPVVEDPIQALVNATLRSGFGHRRRNAA